MSHKEPEELKKRVDTIRKAQPAAVGAAALIVSEGNPVLRQKAEDVPLSEIKSIKVQKVIEDMRAALASQSDGVGLAAPQIAVPLRIFIVSKRIFGDDVTKDAIFINPTITKYSKEKKWMEGEGCLSVRWVYGKVQRSTKVTIRAYDEEGRIFERGAGGLLAHIFQHEVDHLDGILFIDKAKDLEEADPADVKKNSERKKLDK
jgi:peptide deformylase